MINNYAHKVTHGFTMVESEVFVESTQIYNTDSMLNKLQKLSLQSVDTGFFNLYLSSQLYLANNTEVRNLWAAKQSVLSAISQSSFFASNNVSFVSNNAESGDGYTLQFANTKHVNID